MCTLCYLIIDEKAFYSDMIFRCAQNGIKVTIGDGTPDSKLLYGIEAVRASGIKASVFVKPYPDEKILERFEWAHDIAELGGIDIDSYSIITMRNLVHLEKKNADNLIKIKNFLSKKGIPFAIKPALSDQLHGRQNHLPSADFWIRRCACCSRASNVFENCGETFELS